MAGLSLALAFLVSLVIALLAVIVNGSPGSRFMGTLPMAATGFLEHRTS
ncbi:hypothetical protein [Streptomyces sp. NPDC001100]